MTRMKLIIACIDNYLETTNQQIVTPVEANKELERCGLLSDSKERPGLPLRRLLREDQIPHAYKEDGRWYIPHS